MLLMEVGGDTHTIMLKQTPLWKTINPIWKEGQSR